MKAKVTIALKPGVLDPQGKAALGALHHLGFDGVSEVKIGKSIELELVESDRAKAETTIKQMCEKLLANTVVENYRIELVGL